METNRRAFLGGAVALFAATALPVQAFAGVAVPVIYGDGVHDDWAGLQALLDGKPFRVADSAAPMILRSNGHAVIRNGRFLVSNTLRLSERGSIVNSHFKATREMPAMLDLPSGWRVGVVSGNYFEGTIS